MIAYFSCNISWFGFKVWLFFAKYLSVGCFFSCSQLQQLSLLPQLWYHFVLKVNFEEELLPQKIIPGLLTQRFWYPFKPFLLFNRFLHAQKIIIFVVVFWKACDIPWKWNRTVNICLFSYFNLTFDISQQQ